MNTSIISNAKGDYYIGIMSGTSLDAIDVSLVKITDNQTQYIAAIERPFDEELRGRLLSLCQDGNIHLKTLGELTVELSLAYADGVNLLLNKHNINPTEVMAIGCHGQTVFHSPQGEYPFSMQLINASVLAANTGITTVSDFRSMDLALGGQGAPLVPTFHQSLVGSNDEAVFLNIGGIANLSIISPNKLVGFDTGPGNILIDSWVQQKFSIKYDDNGSIAKQGIVIAPLLKNMLADEYFNKVGAKSTGREYFNIQWLSTHLASFLDTEYKNKLSNEDVLATLVALTAQSIARALSHLSGSTIYVCGGGAKNGYLLEQLSLLLPDCTVTTTATLDVDPDYVEAMAFAWLAYRCVNQLPANDTRVTGASKEAILGQITQVN
ncbi:anhydro-N-acetylmuramic acid kinase [Thalassotalea piscium]|uniref:Anhydro-N-acetylmuramic acid kinase n=1 Tax=Thalassotalea piscium TaxID=1230533 RepID=A0A7X0NKD1_9GAMM|nr:anhydro-N-acetylmuramic acid kinase [Thalassotalea piscium]MBB6545049.1 anhydro-N-acetylmuramic acid kinase [Thalassotalea piscium]